MKIRTMTWIAENSYIWLRPITLNRILNRNYHKIFRIIVSFFTEKTSLVFY